MIETKKNKFKEAFSVVEVIIAAAVLALFLAGLASAYVGFTRQIRASGHKQQAAALAEEGLEAARNIRNNSFSNLTDGTYGLATTTSQWNFSGSNDVTGNFIRSVTVSSVNSNQKQVAANVSWTDGTLSRSVSATTFLTNWQSSALTLGGLMVYGIGTTTPQIREYDKTANSFSSASAGPIGGNSRNFVVRTSPTKREAIAGYVSSTGVLQILCYDGTAWTNEWSATVGGTGTTRRFDISYETNAGDAVVLYSTNNSLTNELAFRNKPGSTSCGSANWAAASNLTPLRTTGIVQWVKLAWDRRSSSNLITAIWADSSSDLSGMVWSGTAWGNEPLTAMDTSLEVVNAAQDVDDFDVEYESLSGDVMAVWANSAGANGTNGVRYRVCTGGTSSCTWGAVTTPPTFADDATNLDISANPNTDEMVFASIGNAGSDLQIGYWSGSAWTDTANVDTAADTPLAGTKLVATGWLVSGSTARSVVAYDDSAATNIGWYTGSSSVFTLQTDFTPTPAFATPQKWYDIQTDPLDTSQLMFSLSDNSSDLFAKRLVMTSTPAFTWTNSDASAALTAVLPQATYLPFGFAYYRY